MASRIKHGTLTPATVETVVLNPSLNKVEVLNRGTSDIFVTVDQTTPSVLGDDAEIAQAGTSIVLPVGSSNNTIIKLISSGAVAYTVSGS